MPGAGRSSGAVRPRTTASAVLCRAKLVEQIARTLLKRYGVVFWRLLAREAEWLPPWRELLMALRRLEARGEIRGGRFVAGFSGEQFALPEAVGVLRGTRNEDKAGKLTVVSGADPLNLVGILLPGPKVPALYSNRVLFRDGIANRCPGVGRSAVSRQAAAGAGLGDEEPAAAHPGTRRAGGLDVAIALPRGRIKIIRIPWQPRIC